MQVPREPETPQDLQVSVQAVSQQTLSAQFSLRQLDPSRHDVPLHALQLPPQSVPVSIPFWMLSEQLTQVCVIWSQEGVVPTVQSLLLVQPNPLLVVVVVDVAVEVAVLPPVDVAAPPVPAVLLLPPMPTPGHFSRSLQSSGANRHPGAHAARPSAPSPARISPDRA